MPFLRSKSSKAATDQLMNKESKIKRSFHKSGHRRIKQVSSSTQQTSTLEDERFWLSHSLTEEEDDIEFLKQELPFVCNRPPVSWHHFLRRRWDLLSAHDGVGGVSPVMAARSPHRLLLNRNAD